MNAVPVAEGLFEHSEDGPRLIGTRCTACGAVYFPQTLSCRNPQCRDKTIARALLPDRGILYSYTIQHYRPPALFRADDWAPYALGVVDLSSDRFGGVQVMGMLTGVALDAIAIGMPLRLVTEALYGDAERGVVETYKFAPLDDGAAA